MARGDAFNSIDAFTHCNQSSRSRLEGAANVISVTRDDAPIVALSRNNFSKNGVGALFSFFPIEDVVGHNFDRW